VTELSGFSHVHASLCGRFFCSDVPGRKEIYVGSLKTGKHALLCEFGPDPEDAYKQFGQSSHSHPYLSPDLNWAVFNSCRTGRPEIHVASIPEGMWEELERD